MKKLFAAILIAMTAVLSCTALAEDSKVEISFKVGDSVLSINGDNVEVETPYVAGDGTTLVPLRVITEAFGAKVDWEGQTQTIKLEYPDVNITLQIGNIIAKVNDHNETLLEAPALSKNDVTMVPLRFISETFGATVSYDNATGAILVTKEKMNDSQTVTGITDMARTGDSYYNWSIDTPAAMKMTDRRQDGKSTEFTADDGSIIYVDIYKYTQDTLTPFEEKYSKVKDSFSRYTLTEAEKLKDNAGNQYMHFQAKNSKEIIDYREYYAKNHTNYEVVSRINVSEDTAAKDMILSISDSFKLGSIDNQTYDLSNVAGDMREVKSEKYRLSFKVPADFNQLSVLEAENEFMFFSPDTNNPSAVHLGVFSKTDDVTAQKLAQKDHDNRAKLYNPEFSTVSETESSAGGEYRYTHKISGASKRDYYNTDVFFEKGDYVYNISVTVPSENDAAQAERIIASLKTEDLDAGEIGKLIRNDPENKTLASNTIGDYKISLPASWKKGVVESIGADSFAFANTDIGSMITVAFYDDRDYKSGSLTNEVTNFSKYITEKNGNKLVGKVEYENIDGNRYARFTYQMTNDEMGDSYATVYMTIISKQLIMFTLYERDIYYKGESAEILKNAVESFTKK